MPKNTGAGIIIAGFSFIMSFALIWHIWWLAIIGFVGAIITLITHLTNDDHEYIISPLELKREEAKAGREGLYL